MNGQTTRVPPLVVLGIAGAFAYVVYAFSKSWGATGTSPARLAGIMRVT